VDVRQLRTSDVIRGLSLAIEAGPSVINMSFGVPTSQLLTDTVAVAFRTGSILVAAAGNERQLGTPIAAPANLNHVLTVAATDSQNRVASFSSASLQVDLAAPGVNIEAAIPRAFNPDLYDDVSGTSFSAPIVTGATAWVWTARPQLDQTQIFDLMRYSATDLGQEGFDRDTGFGLLNIPGALTTPAPPSDGQEPNDDIRDVRPNGSSVCDDADHLARACARDRARQARPDRGSGGRLPRVRAARADRPPDDRARHRRRRRSLEADRDDGVRARRGSGAESPGDGRPARADAGAGVGAEPDAARVLRVPRRLPAAERAARRGLHRPAPRPLGDSRGELDRRVEHDVGLAHAHASGICREAREELVRDRCRQRLEQLERTPVGDSRTARTTSR
jgi:hypothetical protein